MNTILKITITTIIILCIIILYYCVYNYIRNDNFEDTITEIPKVIYLSHKESIPNYIIDNWKKLNPDYTIKFYNDNDCRTFIQTYYPPSYIKYFDYLSTFKGSGPIKCDFWRCLILYKFGGVYADSDIEMLYPISFFLEKDTDFLTCNSHYNNSLNPHLIICRPGNIIIEKCIEIYEKEKFNSPYSYWGNDIYLKNNQWISGTGHNIVHIMTSILKNIANYDKNTSYIIYNNNYKIQLLWEFVPRGNIKNAYCSYNNVKILNNRYSGYDPATHTYSKPNTIYPMIKKTLTVNKPIYKIIGNILL